MAALAQPAPLVLKSLREQVYDHLRQLLNRGDLRPGSFLDLGRRSTTTCASS